MEVKEIVKEKYGEAARRVTSGQGLPADCCAEISCCTGSATASCDPITSNLYDEAQAGELPDTALKAHLAAGIPLRLHSSSPAKPSSTWARAAVSMCCSPRGESAPPGKHMAWT